MVDEIFSDSVAREAIDGGDCNVARHLVW
jgi:hypothetical protein